MIGRYEIKEKLGQGGMAAVFRAHDPRFKRDVAIKVLPTAYMDNAMFRARFEREAQVIAALEYPGIVPVYDFGEQNDQPYLVMRFMPGGSLADRISHGPLSLDDAVRIVVRLAPALDHVHSQGIIHRDLKPGNILFDQYDTAYISDFGIARLTEGAVSLTGEALIGTPAYMSPEQAQGLRELDGRSDIYALGAILFEVLTGKQPYEATTPMGVILKHITEPAPRLLAVKADLPAELEAVITHSMEKNRDQRYATAGAMAADLSRMVEGSKNVAPTAVEKQEPAEKPLTWPAPAASIAAEQPPQVEKPTVLEDEQAAASPAPGQPAAPRPQTAPPVPDMKPAQAAPRANVQAAAGPVKGAAIPAGAQPQVKPAAQAGVVQRPASQPGTPRQSGAVAQPVQRPSTAVKPKKKISPLIWIAGIAVVGLVCLVMAISGGWITSLMLSNPLDTQEVVDTPDIVSTEPPGVTPDNTSDQGNSSGYAFQDDFSDPNSGWFVYQGDEGVLGYLSGSYQIKINQTNLMLYSTSGYSTADSLVQVEAFKSDGPDENIFGIICRYQDDGNYYFLAITSNGYYGIGKIADNNTTLIGNKELQYSSVINQGRTYNTLQATCQANRLVLAVNDTRLAEVQDSQFSEGEVGLIAGTYDIYGANILFDNFSVTTLTQP